MIGIVATLKIKEGSGADFEAVASQLVEKVNTNEDGVVYYDLYKQDETTYVSWRAIKIKLLTKLMERQIILESSERKWHLLWEERLRLRYYKRFN